MEKSGIINRSSPFFYYASSVLSSRKFIKFCRHLLDTAIKALS